MTRLYTEELSHHVLRWWAWARRPEVRGAKVIEGGLINLLRIMGWTAGTERELDVRGQPSAS
eukprot:CAMPEP_0177238810 /NCGR_PEP_ID=MMETSP0367-20130122/46767_1 /TAXON_ID=447022 ORGANISM="Scrippsiella hangoei-like, Strain SHHI-4" /NCGR_SAMPLE_ID=MMETSP0367 /ASSEMBLY_ACC=CAM_ASM_000362 /LENGTH=61 /DNA_ID=CAMNT_0018689973 /DNA_START=65 /DNA_END=248 /DNA_ORIENTATION=-